MGNVGYHVGDLIDSLHDRRSGFQFSTNPLGARRDAAEQPASEAPKTGGKKGR
jgi:hypothetical protein